MPPKKQKKSSGTRIFIFLRALLEKNGSVNSVTVLVLSIHQFTAAAKKRRSFSNEDPWGTVWRAQVGVGLSLGEVRVLSGGRVFGKQSAGCKRVFFTWSWACTRYLFYTLYRCPAIEYTVCSSLVVRDIIYAHECVHIRTQVRTLVE